jgi:hypothetical protein
VVGFFWVPPQKHLGAAPRADDRRVCGTIDAAHRDIGIGARDTQALDAISVDQRYGSDCRRLVHETQYVKAVAFIGSLGPRQLDGPFQLATNLVQKTLYAGGCRARFGAQAQAQIGPLISVSEPGFAGAASEERDDDGGEKDNKILSEQGAAHPGARSGLVV